MPLLSHVSHIDLRPKLASSTTPAGGGCGHQPPAADPNHRGQRQPAFSPRPHIGAGGVPPRLPPSSPPPSPALAALPPRTPPRDSRPGGPLRPRRRRGGRCRRQRRRRWWKGQRRGRRGRGGGGRLAMAARAAAMWGAATTAVTTTACGGPTAILLTSHGGAQGTRRLALPLQARAKTSAVAASARHRNCIAAAGDAGHPPPSSPSACLLSMTVVVTHCSDHRDYQGPLSLVRARADWKGRRPEWWLSRQEVLPPIYGVFTKPLSIMQCSRLFCRCKSRTRTL